MIVIKRQKNISFNKEWKKLIKYYKIKVFIITIFDVIPIEGMNLMRWVWENYNSIIFIMFIILYLKNTM